MSGTGGNRTSQVLTSHSYETENQGMKPHASVSEGCDLSIAVSDAGHREDHTSHSLRASFFLPAQEQDSRDQQRGCLEGRDSHAFLHRNRHPANSYPALLLSTAEGATFCCRLVNLYSERCRD